MSRITQPKAERGSQHWLQYLISLAPELLSNNLRKRLDIDCLAKIHWFSPLERDCYAEYRDAEFLDLLDINLERRSLNSFWPVGGPVWDGLGKTDDGQVLLVEAKSHAAELISPPCKAGCASSEIIKRSLDEAKSFYGVDPTANWTGRCYQYANRIAHLYLLREVNKVPAWLVFLYFLNDSEMGGPSSQQEWQESIGQVHAHLCLKDVKLPYALDVFISVEDVLQQCSQTSTGS